MLTFNIITIFPKIFDSYFGESIIGRAVKKKLVEIKIYNLRDGATDKHQKVDDKPYGGGPGMVFKVEPIYNILKKLKLLDRVKRRSNKELIIMLDPAGEKFDQNMAKNLAKNYKRVVLLCGHYEGFDARAIKLIDKRVSIGDYVLTGGEVPAMAIVDAVSRLVPGVLGKEESLSEETFSKENFVEYPQYTRPEIFKKWRVPKILLSGNHKEIKEWRNKRSREIEK